MKKWRNEITNLDVKDNGVQQAILNLMFNEWVKSCTSLSYEDMVRKFWNDYDGTAAFAVLIGKYNQQVCNGGHYQYFQNGFAGKDKDQYLGLHRDLINLFPIDLLNEPDLFQNTIIQKVYTILNKFKVVLDNDRYITEEYWDDHLGEEVTEQVENPNFGEVENYHELDELDKEYYEVYEQFMILLENYFEAKYHESCKTK